MRDDKRDSLRATVFRCSTPRVTPRCSSGCACLKAPSAFVLSPSAIALSTALTKVRIRLTRARLMTVRRWLRRIRVLADLWWAIALTLSPRFPRKGGGYSRRSWARQALLRPGKSPVLRGFSNSQDDRLVAVQKARKTAVSDGATADRVSQQTRSCLPSDRPAQRSNGTAVVRTLRPRPASSRSCG